MVLMRQADSLMALQVWVLPGQAGSNPGLLNPVGTASSTEHNVGQGMKTGDAENLGNGSGNQFNEMAFSIEKVLVDQVQSTEGRIQPKLHRT